MNNSRSPDHQSTLADHYTTRERKEDAVTLVPAITHSRNKLGILHTAADLCKKEPWSEDLGLEFSWWCYVVMFPAGDATCEADYVVAL
ncbi:hypothetical protein ACROYT_G015024 [Oculina patagonica]